MIKSVPQSSDFVGHGIDYLNLAWSSVINLHVDAQMAEEYRSLHEEDEEVGRGRFWTAAERELGTALSLVGQGAEFLLKGRICDISPWLLITKNPTDWPRKSEREDVSFSQFRTIDAQDLIKVHDTFAAERLPDGFHVAFDSLRKQRNALMHTVDTSIRLTAADILEKTLLITEYLLGGHTWINHRRSYVERDRNSTYPYENGFEFYDYQIAREISTALDLLTPKLIRRFFGFDKRQRSYICPYCSNLEHAEDLECRTAQLRPNSPTSKSVFCFVCERTSEVIRANCIDPDCKGNVRDEGHDQCLTCREDSEPRQ